MDVGVGMMQVEVTNRCNLNCPHCPLGTTQSTDCRVKADK